MAPRLEQTFPLLHQNLRLEKINQYSLLYTWEGSDPSAKPIILMSHQDVVPVDQPTLGAWEAGPFEGKITDTHIIGRGTMDDKGSLMAVMESIEMLLKEGFKPKRTVYLAFGHDEEVGGANGAARIAALLKEKGIQAAMTLDEGGFIAEDMIPGIESPVAMVNLAEKGFASFRLIVETRGGHSSQPPKDNTIGMLARAIVELEANQLPYKLVEPINYQFEYMGAELPFFKKLAFANPWLFKKPILEALNAHTTTAPTIIEDNCFIGARSEVVEGVIVEKGSVLSMGVYIGQSTRIYDRTTDEILYGRVPAGSVVVSGNLPSADGKYSLYCAVIVKRVDEKTRSKVGINELLRDI